MQYVDAAYRLTHGFHILYEACGVTGEFPENSDMTDMKKITKDMTVTEILRTDPMISNILAGYGMGCLFCGAAINESLSEACAVHGITPEETDLMVEQINDFLGGP